jgi:DNA gyrase subunit A
MEKFKLSDRQSQAILDLRLQRLTGLERQKIDDEYVDVLGYHRLSEGRPGRRP